MKTYSFMLSVSAALVSISFSTVSARADDGDLTAIQGCLAHWGKTPFSKKDPTFRTLSAKVKVLGIGGETVDDQVTTAPDLVLIKPNVAVLSKATLNLLNPEGWYCLKGQVSVLGKSEIHLHCSAHLASSKDGATVLGGSDTDQGVTVLGSTRVMRLGSGCVKAQ
jgi:hypothetical protein